MIWFSLKPFSGLLLILLPVFFFLVLTTAWAKPNKIVLAYSAHWLDEIYPPEAYNYQGMTHITRSFLEVDADGHLPVPEGYFNQALSEKAKKNGVKLLASIGGASAGEKNWLSMAKNPQYQKRFFNELEKLIQDNHYDGVDIDWETMPQTDEDAKAFLSFMKALRARFPKWILTTAVMAGDKWAKFLNWQDLSQSVDYIGLMTYDFSGDWSEYAYHHANLYSDPSSKAEEGISADETVHRLETKYGVKPGKLLLGVPFYGKNFLVANWNDPLPKEGKKLTGMRYSEALQAVKDGEYTEMWDEKAQAPYLKKKNGLGMVTYETPRSLALKCKYVVDQKLSGIIIWVLGSDLVGNRTPLLDQVALSFGSRARAIPPSAMAQMEAAYLVEAKKEWDELSGLRDKLTKAGKKEEALAAEPNRLPDLTPAKATEMKKLIRHLEELQSFLNDATRKTRTAKRALGLDPNQ